MDHTYSCSKYGFRKNTIESEEAPIRFINQQIWDRVRRLPKITELGNLLDYLAIEYNTIGPNKAYSRNYYIGRITESIII